MHEAVKNARNLKNKKAEHVARLNVSEEQIRGLRAQSQKVKLLELENERLKGVVKRHSERTVLLAYTTRQWEKLSRVLGDPEMPEARMQALEESDAQLFF